MQICDSTFCVNIAHFRRVSRELTIRATWESIYKHRGHNAAEPEVRFKEESNYVVRLDQRRKKKAGRREGVRERERERDFSS